MKTISAQNARNANLSMDQLAALMHDHSHIKTADHASLFKTGELDVGLLKKADLHVDPTLAQHPIVSIELAAMTVNFANRRNEPVYLARSTETGKIQGHYFASAFKRLVA